MGLFSTKKRQKPDTSSSKKDKNISQIEKGLSKTWTGSTDNEMNSFDDDENDWGSMGLERRGPSHEPKTPLRHSVRFSDYYECNSPVNDSAKENKSDDLIFNKRDLSTPIAPKKIKMKGLRQKIFSTKKKKRNKFDNNQIKQGSIPGTEQNLEGKTQSKQSTLFSSRKNPNRKTAIVSLSKTDQNDVECMSSSDETEAICNKKKNETPIRGILKHNPSYSSNRPEFCVTPQPSLASTPNAVRFEDEDTSDEDIENNLNHVNTEPRDEIIYHGIQTHPYQTPATQNKSYLSPYNQDINQHFLPQYLPSEPRSPLANRKRNLRQIGTPDGGICSSSNVTQIIARTQTVLSSRIVVAIRKTMADCIAPSIPDSPLLDNAALPEHSAIVPTVHAQSLKSPILAPCAPSKPDLGWRPKKDNDEYIGAPRKKMDERPQLKRLDPFGTTSRKYNSNRSLDPITPRKRKEYVLPEVHHNQHSPKRLKEHMFDHYLGDNDVNGAHHRNSFDNEDGVVDRYQIQQDTSPKTSSFDERPYFELPENNSLSEYSDHSHISSRVHQDFHVENNFSTPTKRKNNKRTSQYSNSFSQVTTNSPRDELLDFLSECSSEVTASTISDVSETLGSETNFCLITEDNDSFLLQREHHSYFVSGTKPDLEPAGTFISNNQEDYREIPKLKEVISENELCHILDHTQIDVCEKPSDQKDSSNERIWDLSLEKSENSFDSTSQDTVSTISNLE